eukprot:scaffold212_cov404-Prasinococcus_capsulatus_cf.AAC.6
MTAISSSPSASSPSVCDSPKALVFLPLEGRTPASPGLRVSLSRDLFLPVSGSPVSSVVSPKCIKGNGALTSALELPPTWLAFRCEDQATVLASQTINTVLRKPQSGPGRAGCPSRNDACQTWYHSARPRRGPPRSSWEEKTTLPPLLFAFVRSGLS